MNNTSRYTWKDSGHRGIEVGVLDRRGNFDPIMVMSRESFKELQHQMSRKQITLEEYVNGDNTNA